MKNEILNTTILAFAFLMLFALAELFNHISLGVRAELTRKLVHFGTGVLTLLFQVMLKQPLGHYCFCAPVFFYLNHKVTAFELPEVY